MPPGGNVTLTCDLSSGSVSTSYYPSWYQQTPGQAPFFRPHNGALGKSHRPRFGAHPAPLPPSTTAACSRPSLVPTVMSTLSPPPGGEEAKRHQGGRSGVAPWPSRGLWGQALRAHILAPPSVYCYRVQTVTVKVANVLRFPEHFHLGQPGRTPKQGSLGDSRGLRFQKATPGRATRARCPRRGTFRCFG